jgi:hypothetical protein
MALSGLVSVTGFYVNFHPFSSRFSEGFSGRNPVERVGRNHTPFIRKDIKREPGKRVADRDYFSVGIFKVTRSFAI